MAPLLPSPAIALVGRHNSGKTTLIEKLIECLCSKGLDVGSIKHHGHAGFDIDIPGKDSYRHRAAGASETYIVAPGQMACIKTIPGDMECDAIVANMPGHDIVLVEGYRKSGLPSIEVMRAANERDLEVANALEAASREGLPLTTDFIQAARRSSDGSASNLSKATDEKMPLGSTVAIASDIPLAHEAAKRYGLPAFDINDVEGIARFIKDNYVRPRMSLVIQAGGESKRMGQSKALVQFDGKPLIQRIVQRMLPVADELIITTNEAERLAFLFDVFPEAPLRLVEDELDERGALPGLYSALKAARNPITALIACDMVFASPRLVAYEYKKLSSSEAEACVPVNAHGFEPFHAVYRTIPCLYAVEESLEDGCQRIKDVLSKLEVIELQQYEVHSVEPAGRCFFNANTPEELEKAHALLEAEDFRA